MIPLKDLNPSRRFPVVNVGLILVNAAVFLYTAALPPRAEQAFLTANALVPIRLPEFLAGHDYCFIYRGVPWGEGRSLC